VNDASGYEGNLHGSNSNAPTAQRPQSLDKQFPEVEVSNSKRGRLPMATATENTATSTTQRRGSLWKKILLVLLILVLAFLGFAATLPEDYRVERSTTINAPAEAVFNQVNDFHNWNAWSPWAKLDPNAKNTFDGAASGVGAVFKWSGNDEVGEGSMTLLESRPQERIQIRLVFIRPFEDTADVEFKFQPQGEQTMVTWTMSGKHDFVTKIICYFMNMDKMLGSDFEKGLASLKATAESPPPS
jgi:uncharacterized protein YndB with AHSA1/START domain